MEELYDNWMQFSRILIAIFVLVIFLSQSIRIKAFFITLKEKIQYKRLEMKRKKEMKKMQENESTKQPEQQHRPTSGTKPLYKDIADNQGEEETSNKNQRTPDELDSDTLKWIQDCMVTLGCQPELGNSKDIIVTFQGETFIMQPNRIFLRIVDPAWFSMNNTDPLFELLKQAVNTVNWFFGPTVILTNPDENGNVGVHSRMDILLPSTMPIPERHQYIRVILDLFFEVKQNLKKELHNLVEFKQKEMKENKRPIGFQYNI